MDVRLPQIVLISKTYNGEIRVLLIAEIIYPVLIRFAPRRKLTHRRASVQTEKKGCRLSPFECEDEGVYNEVNDRCLSHKKEHKMCAYLNGPNRGEGYRLGAFKCENEGVYNEVNDRCLSHEKRAQDVPLSSVWSR